ncbi:MAG: hypothetical protein ACU836_14710 [Gammaproteobacteria bacterium]
MRIIMKKHLQKQGYLSFLLLCLAGSAVAVQNDPSGGACDGLDPSGMLFSTCLQAHSAASRVDRLTLVGASARAIDEAQASLDEAIAKYAALGGGVVPGFEEPLQIGGEGPGGGIIFSLSETGLHGLEAAPADQDYAPWGCFGTLIPGADGTAIGDGAQNTADILAGCSEPGIAAQVAANYLWPNGQTDGFLPSKDELNAMYTNIGPGAPAPNTNVGGFANVYYWSSTEGGSLSAWLQNFNYGDQSGSVKDVPLRVRAVRAF